MKKLSILIIISCFAIIATAQSTYEYQKRFQVQSGHVEYKLSGLTVGTKSLWWDDYGKNTVKKLKAAKRLRRFLVQQWLTIIRLQSLMVPTTIT